jgi:hypothetical protein
VGRVRRRAAIYRHAFEESGSERLLRHAFAGLALDLPDQSDTLIALGGLYLVACEHGVDPPPAMADIAHGGEAGFGPLIGTFEQSAHVAHSVAPFLEGRSTFYGDHHDIAAIRWRPPGAATWRADHLCGSPVSLGVEQRHR